MQVMGIRKPPRGRVVAVVPPAALMAITLATGGAGPDGGAPLPGLAEFLLWSMVAALAALHRPLGGDGLGLGTLVLPSVTARLGAAPAALLAAAARLLAVAFARFAARRGREAGGLGREMVTASVIAVAAFAGAAAAESSVLQAGRFAWRASVPAAAYVLSFVGLAALGARAPFAGVRRLWPAASTSHFAALGLDAAGWVLGALLADSAPELGWWRTALIMLAMALLAAEAARLAIARGASDHRVGDYERLHQAHERILGETSGMGAVAQQVLTECSNILPVHWFHFELGSPEEPRQPGAKRPSWSAGPDGVLATGRPRPEARPQMLPGVHRRVAWHILEEPLMVEGETEAVVKLWCDPRRIEEGAEELFATLVPQMASSVHRARLDREASLDPLTEVPVRRRLESGLQRAFAASCQEGRPLAVIMCDVDHFKKINDGHGHAAGDEALKRVARALDGERREGDVLARYGGEEFTLLLEGTGGVAALQLAERLRHAVAAIDLRYEGRAIALTISLGVAAFPDLHIKTATELLLLADEALYEAKRRGRNRCLLNLGRGAFGAVDGSPVGAPAPLVRAPRIFD